MSRRALILGISGQDGSYLSHLLLHKGYQVFGSSRDSTGPFAGLIRLGIRDRVTIHGVDLSDSAAVRGLIARTDPSEIYLLSGQSSVGRSFASPAETFSSIAGATLNVVEALRQLGHSARLFNAASTDSYGHCEQPATEETPFRPRSPYGMAKAAAFEIARSYREAYGLFAASGILSNHESPLRPEQFVTTKIIRAVMCIAEGGSGRLKLGNISVERDWGWTPDYVEAYWRMLQEDAPSDFIIATGETYALSEFVATAFAAVGLDGNGHLDFDSGLLRASEFRTTSVNPTKAKRILGWRARHQMHEVVRLLLARQSDCGLGPLGWES